MKSAVIYANCQGGMLETMLKSFAGFSSEYDVVHIENCSVLEGKSKLPRELISNCDLFIYQPLSEKWIGSSTADLLGLLKPGCLAVSFPYVYSDCFILYAIGNDIAGKESILALMRNHSSGEIIEMFKSLEIDFDLQSRFARSLEILEQHERICDVKISDTIGKYYQSERLFYTQNHCSERLMRPVISEVLKRVGIAEPVDCSISNYSKLRWPISPYEEAAFDYEFEDVYPDWQAWHINLITRILTGQYENSQN